MTPTNVLELFVTAGSQAIGANVRHHVEAACVNALSIAKTRSWTCHRWACLRQTWPATRTHALLKLARVRCQQYAESG